MTHSAWDQCGLQGDRIVTGLTRNPVTHVCHFLHQVRLLLLARGELAGSDVWLERISVRTTVEQIVHDFQQAIGVTTHKGGPNICPGCDATLPSSVSSVQVQATALGVQVQERKKRSVLVADKALAIGEHALITAHNPVYRTPGMHGRRALPPLLNALFIQDQGMGTSNVAIRGTQCTCGHQLYATVATRVVAPGHQLVAEVATAVTYEAHNVIIIQFDGSCRAAKTAAPAGGAGVVVWELTAAGLVLRDWGAYPDMSIHDAAEAEALAAAYAVVFLKK